MDSLDTVLLLLLLLLLAVVEVAVAIGLAYCSVDGTLVRLPVAYCSADGTLVTAYCSTEIVLVRLPPPPPPPVPPEACCCSADGILVRVPKLLAEQLVVIVDVPPNATERRFGL